MQLLKKIFRDYQGLIISVGILVVCGCGFVFGVFPLAQKVITLSNEYRSLSVEVDDFTNKASVLQAVDEDALRGNLQTLLSAVPSDKSLSTLLGTLDGLTAKTGVSVESFSLAKLGSLATASAARLNADELAVGSNILPFTISMTGTPGQVRDFLTTALSVRRLFRIRTFDVSFLNANAATATVAMDVFYSPLPTTIGSAGQPVTLPTSKEDDLIAKVGAMQLLVVPASSLPPPSGGAGKSDPFSL